MGVVVHYLDKDLINRSYLIGMRRINGAHTGEDIAEAVMLIEILWSRAILNQSRDGIGTFNKATGLGQVNFSYINFQSTSANGFGRLTDLIIPNENDRYSRLRRGPQRQTWLP